MFSLLVSDSNVASPLVHSPALSSVPDTNEFGDEDWGDSDAFGGTSAPASQLGACGPPPTLACIDEADRACLRADHVGH